MKDLLKKREIEEMEVKDMKEKKEMKESSMKKKMKETVQKKRKEQIVNIVKKETQDMKAMILNLLNFDWIVPRLQQ